MVNNSSTPLPLFASLHSHFEAQVNKTPNAVAVVTQYDNVSYQALDYQANKLADKILSLPLQCKVIPIHIDRSANYLVAIIGILKAGCSYIPLDSKIPQDRITAILQEAQATIVVTDQAELPFNVETVIDINAVITDQSLSNKRPEIDVYEDHIAYTIFTSGSTGMPKGVNISHAAIVNYALDITHKIKLHDHAQYAHISTLTADLGLTMLFPALLNGATLHLLSNALFLDANKFSDYIKRNKIDCLKITPSHFSALLNSTAPKNAIPLKTLIFGGEPLPTKLVEKIKTLSADVDIYNHYGPTESTVGVLTWKVDLTKLGDTQNVPLGFTLHNIKIYVVQEGNKLAQSGETGELIISGVGLSNGYLNRDDLTAEKFIENPFDSDPKFSRAYRTGDLVKLLDDGNIEFLGRIDSQVKIRGHRVELEEIERCINSAEGVDNNAVIAKNNRIYAYVTSTQNNATEKTVLAFTKLKLPDYMVPSYFILLDELPLTSNGKVDKKSLEIPEEAPLVSMNGTPKQPKTIRKIYAKQLRIKKVDPLDTFVSLGGDSLDFIQVSLALELILGDLPTDWENTPIKELEKRPIEKSNKISLGPMVWLRALAITVIVINSANLLGNIKFYGGAYFLLLLAGMSFARFQLKNITKNDKPQAMLSILPALMLPVLAILILEQLRANNFEWSQWLFVSNLISPDRGGFWFINVWVQVYIAVFLLFLLLPMTRFVRKSPKTTSFSVLLVGVAIALISPLFWDTKHLYDRVPQDNFWLFALGWCLYVAGKSHKVLLSFICVTIPFVIFGFDKTASYWACFGGIALIWLNDIHLHRLGARALANISAASLYIYITHEYFISAANKLAPVAIAPVFGWLTAIVGGVVISFIADHSWHILTKSSWWMKSRLKV